MWQALHEELAGQGFTCIAIALDSGGPAKTEQWIRAAKPTYPCLIDERHLTAELYGVVNVPMGVWIDETGRIVRPAETAATSDAFRRHLDWTTKQMSAEGLAGLHQPVLRRQVAVHRALHDLHDRHRLA